MPKNNQNPRGYSGSINEQPQEQMQPVIGQLRELYALPHDVFHNFERVQWELARLTRWGDEKEQAWLLWQAIKVGALSPMFWPMEPFSRLTDAEIAQRLGKSF
jgi:hypothetical protein